MMTFTVSSRTSGAKPPTPYSTSPPAMGWEMRRWISRVSAVCSGATGSSYHRSFSGSSRRATRSASATSKKLWQSTIRSRPGPTAARIDSMHAMPSSTAASMAAGAEPFGGNPSNGAAFSARNPCAAAAAATSPPFAAAGSPRTR